MMQQHLSTTITKSYIKLKFTSATKYLCNSKKIQTKCVYDKKKFQLHNSKDNNTILCRSRTSNYVKEGQDMAAIVQEEMSIKQDVKNYDDISSMLIELFDKAMKRNNLHQCLDIIEQYSN